MPVKGIFFDLYGTLLDYHDLKSAWKKWLDALYESFASSGMELRPQEFFAACQNLFGDDSYYTGEKSGHLTIFEQRVDGLARKLGVKLEDICALSDKCVSDWHGNMSFDPQAEPLLKKLKKKYTIVLLSNFDHPPYVHGLLEQNGLTSLFDHVVISGEVGVQKPDVRIFEHALKAASLSANEVIHVGDSISDDVFGAHEAGITPVLIVKDGYDEIAKIHAYWDEDNRTDSDAALPEGTHCIKSLDEVVDICRARL